MKNYLLSFSSTEKPAFPGIAFFLLLLVNTNFGFSQELISAGPKFGVSMATLTGKDAANASVNPRFLAGAFLSVKPSSAFALQVELNYTQKGARIRNTILTTSHVRLAYLEVPVLARFCYASSAKTTPYLATGPSVNFLMNARNTYLKDQAVTQQYKKVDLGWSFGAGLEMDFKHKWWMLDLRYTPGFTKLIDQANPPAVRTAVFTLSTALGFELYDRYGNRRR